MANERIFRTQTVTLAAHKAVGAILVLGLALTLAGCIGPFARTSNGVERSGALVKDAVDDAEKVALRALAYHGANVRKRAAIEVEEAEVILRKARNEQERVRKAHRAAMAVLKAMPDRGSDATVAAENVDRIATILAATDRNVATIEDTVATLQDLEIPGRR
jgi:hypothetical protein